MLKKCFCVDSNDDNSNVATTVFYFLFFLPYYPWQPPRRTEKQRWRLYDIDWYYLQLPSHFLIYLSDIHHYRHSKPANVRHQDVSKSSLWRTCLIEAKRFFLLKKSILDHIFGVDTDLYLFGAQTNFVPLFLPPWPWHWFRWVCCINKMC